MVGQEKYCEKNMSFRTYLLLTLWTDMFVLTESTEGYMCTPWEDKHNSEGCHSLYLFSLHLSTGLVLHKAYIFQRLAMSIYSNRYIHTSQDDGTGFRSLAVPRLSVHENILKIVLPQLNPTSAFT